MAYFANGTEYMDWASWNCDKCVNDDDNQFCKIMEMHHTLEDQNILDSLIPRKDGWNLQCTMFKEANPFFHNWDGIGTRFRNEIPETEGIK